MAKRASEIEKCALQLAERTALRQGVYIVDVTYGKGVLCYYIDKEGGVGIDDCEAFSREIETILDRENLIDEEYSLDVSSPGADRQLKKEREFLYYRGREVEVKLYAQTEGVKEFTGVLSDFRDGVATIENDAKRFDIPLKNAVYIRLKFDFCTGRGA